MYSLTQIKYVRVNIICMYLSIYLAVFDTKLKSLGWWPWKSKMDDETFGLNSLLLNTASIKWVHKQNDKWLVARDIDAGTSCLISFIPPSTYLWIMEPFWPHQKTFDFCKRKRSFAKEMSSWLLHKERGKRGFLAHPEPTIYERFSAGQFVDLVHSGCKLWCFVNVMTHEINVMNAKRIQEAGEVEDKQLSWLLAASWDS